MEKVKTFQLKIVLFTAVKNCSISHRRVFDMIKTIGASLLLTENVNNKGCSTLDGFSGIFFVCFFKLLYCCFLVATCLSA